MHLQEPSSKQVTESRRKRRLINDSDDYYSKKNSGEKVQRINDTQVLGGRGPSDRKKVEHPQDDAVDTGEMMAVAGAGRSSNDKGVE